MRGLGRTWSGSGVPVPPHSQHGMSSTLTQGATQGERPRGSGPGRRPRGSGPGGAAQGGGRGGAVKGGATQLKQSSEKCE